MVAKTKKMKRAKVRPPRVYRNKSGKPYIVQKGKKYYLNFGKKTNDLSTLQIVKLFMKYLNNKPRERGITPKSKKKEKMEDLRKVQSLSEIEQNTRTDIQDHLDKPKQEKYEGIEALEKKEKSAREEAEAEKKRQERKDLADAKERKDVLDREHKREQAEAKERQEEIDRERKKEQRLIQELNAERRHRQGLLMAPLAPPMIPPPPPGRPPRKTRGVIVKDVGEEEKHKQTKREKIIDGMFAETIRKKRRNVQPTNEKIIQKLRFIGHVIPDIKPSRGGKINYSEMLKQWLYKSPVITDEILNSNQAWVVFDLWREGAVAKKKEEVDKAKENEEENKVEQENNGEQENKGQQENKEEPVVQEPEDAQQEQANMTEAETEPESDAVGIGKVGKGLMTSEINDIMKKHDWYLGTIASDEIHRLNPEKRKKYGFIMNTDPSNKKGQHWMAIWVSLNKDRSVEVYDPLAEYQPTEDFQEQMKRLIDKSHPDSYLLMKVNQVKQQSDTSDTCGWHSMRFLMERAKGVRFKFASGYTDLKEEEAEKLKAQNGYGFDTFLSASLSFATLIFACS